MIKQFVPSKVCIKCQGCCRFAKKESAWQVNLLDSEIKSLSKDYLKQEFLAPDYKIKLTPCVKEDSFFCVFLNNSNNKCKIYSRRPFECQLYPFVINKRENKVFLSVDLNCPFARDNFQKKYFQKYLDYLISVFKEESTKQALKNNPQVIQSYAGVQNLWEIF